VVILSLQGERYHNHERKTIMLMSITHEVSEIVTGLIGVGFIVWAVQ